MLKRINDALPDLVIGILLYGAVLQVAGIWFAADKLRYSTGLWIGIALAVGMAVHIAIIIRDAVDYAASGSNDKVLAAKSALRYIVIVIVFFVMMKFNLGNLISAFLGVMGLKIAAYLQPYFLKLKVKFKGKGDEQL